MHRTLYTLFCPPTRNTRLTVTPSNEIKRNPPSLSPSLLSSLSLPLSVVSVPLVSVAAVRARGSEEVPATWPTTPLRSLRSDRPLRSRGRATGAFLFTRATSCSPCELCFSFLSRAPSLARPRRVSRPRSSRFFRTFLPLFFPLFLLLQPRGPSHRGDYATHNGEI